MFKRVKEDFVCEQCGAAVSGNGYTNHCPKCLWSKHVDIDPGDRAEACCGLMEPVGAEEKSGGFDIVHRCARCGAERRNKVVEGDDFDAVARI
jgi:Zn finger protein HypA/HybF involved in hydrogenase expression